jgi:hypothetical protein
MAEGDEAAVATFVGENIMCDFALWKAPKSPDEPQLTQSVLTPVFDALTHFRTSVRDSAPLDSIALTKHSDLWLHHLRPVDISDQQHSNRLASWVSYILLVMAEPGRSPASHKCSLVIENLARGLYVLIGLVRLYFKHFIVDKETNQGWGCT